MMVYMAGFHAISRTLAPVPKVQRPAADEYENNGSGYDTQKYAPPGSSVHNDNGYYNNGGHWPTRPDVASFHSHGAVSAPPMPPGAPPVYFDEPPPPLPPRRSLRQAQTYDQPQAYDQSGVLPSPIGPPPISEPKLDVKDPDTCYQQDYAPPPGPPPAHLIGLAPSPSLPTLAGQDLDQDTKPEVLPALPQRPKTINNTLPKPIAIPSVNTELGSPYMRAYPPCLDHFGIPMPTFLRFLDRLNRISTASPPLMILGIGAGIAGLVPEPTTAIVATAVEAACELGQYAISYGRVELLLREVNRDIFGPKGLKAQIAKLNVVAKLAGMPILDEKGKLLSSKAAKEEEDDNGNVLRGVAGTKILAPLEDIHEVHSLSAQHRRVRALAPWTMPLVHDNLPDEEAVAQVGDFEEAEELNEESEKAKGKGKVKEISVIGKMHQYASNYQREEGEKKLLKDRKKALDRLTESRQKAREQRDEKLQDLEEEEARVLEKLEKKRRLAEESGRAPGSDVEELEKKLEKIAHKRDVKVPEEYEKRLEKVQKKYEEGDKEEKGIREVHFLIITDKDDIDSQTQDVEVDADRIGELAEEGERHKPGYQRSYRWGK